MFKQSFRSAARSLKGRVLTIGDRKVEVVDAQGYSRRDNEGHPYAPVLQMKPGEFFCPQFRGGLLLLIACEDDGKPGGCVLVRKVKVGGELVNGPGRVCQALGFNDPVARGQVTERGTELLLRVTA